MKTWDDYKNHVKSVDSEIYKDIEEVEKLSSAVSAIRRLSESQSNLYCEILSGLQDILDGNTCPFSKAMADIRNRRGPNTACNDQHEFSLQRFGEGFILPPVNDHWAALRASLGAMPQEFMEDREQPSWDNLPDWII